LHISQESAPGFVLAILTVFMWVVLILIVRDPKGSSAIRRELPPLDYKSLHSGLFLCILLHAALYLSITTFEVYLIPFGNKGLGWGSETTLIIYTIIGVIVITTSFMIGVLSSFIGARFLIITSVIAFIIGAMFDLQIFHQKITSKVGYTAIVMSSITLITCGFTTCAVLLPTIYSMIVDYTDHSAYKGTLMGWLGSSGSFGKMVGPFLVLFLYVWDDLVAVTIMSLLGVVFVITIVCFKWIKTKYIKQFYMTRAVIIHFPIDQLEDDADAQVVTSFVTINDD